MSGSNYLPLHNGAAGSKGSLSSSAAQPVLSVIAYASSSILMTVTNKYVLSSYKFTMNFLFLAIQCGTVVLLLELFRALGLLTHRPFRWSEAKAWFPVSVLLCAMIYTGSKALQYLSVPLFTVFKNTTIIAIAYAERFMGQGSPVSPLMLLSFMLMVGSSLVAGWSHITDESGGLKGEAAKGEVGWQVAYLWMLANCATSAAYSVGMRIVQRTVAFRDYDTVLYNNALALPLLVAASLFVEADQWRSGRFYEARSDSDTTGLIWVVAISSVTSFYISYASSWCVRVTSSTTFSMVGALNKLPIAVAGMVLFDDPVTTAQVVGVAIAFIAGIVYAQAKNVQSAAARAVPKAPSVPSHSPSLEKSFSVHVEDNGRGNGHLGNGTGGEGKLGKE
ncbi:UDP-galactose transporter [Gonapodya prolifera JEL478]|uniref:GDP-mannose transporter n=1 Tax=Gonapodya prolifera (strain JEL478) TaxID=1344416 RepID=A0A139AGG3_GONPJ|nr:UDP-galactose transporter [Gonapodya prolifera JEL478]|eukprot:KXS15840.1 UDP-galactose transporter [Gonapodya prolifera JEL478]